MRIIVTGGAGFIGSHVVRLLIEENHEVLNIDKLTYAGSLENLDGYVNNPSHRFERVDICDDKKIRALFEDFKPHAVLHMAAESHVDRSIDSPQVFIETNVLGTHVMVRAAYDYWKELNEDGKHTFRFLHLSTDEVFGALGKSGYFSEETPYNPNSPYASSKASSDLLVRSYWRTYGLPTIITNCSNNYGPNQYPEKLIPLTILNALEEKPLPVYGKGEQIRDWLYVKDHANALLKIITAAHPGTQYCIGGKHEIRNIDLVQKLCEILDRKQPRKNGKSYKELIHFVEDRPGHDFRYATDVSKVEKDMGWRADTGFDQGISETLDWYLANNERMSALNARSRIGRGG